MERLSSFRTRLVWVGVLIASALLQAAAGLMCVPADLAPAGTAVGWFVRQERTWLPWLFIGINAVVLLLFVRTRKMLWIGMAIGLSTIHGVVYTVAFNQLNLYPSWDWRSVPFFMGMYWTLAAQMGIGFGIIKRGTLIASRWVRVFFCKDRG